MDSYHRSERTQSGTFGWGYFIVGVLFVVAAFISFTDPTGNLEALAMAFGVLAILDGVWNLMNRGGTVFRVVLGILDILIGVFLIANIWLAAAALPYVFAVWFIADSLVRLLTVGITRLFGTGYFVLSIILNIVGIGVGIMLLFHPVIAALTLSLLVGFYLMLAGIEFIVLAFASRKLV